MTKTRIVGSQCVATSNCCYYKKTLLLTQQHAITQCSLLMIC